ncbi:MAG: AgmX/PglI C-terminal domain-containing protein [Myxococcaceae bacterium]|nr:AgmX/PglI C-terminal domain-containing protein [Myxococcaceae bacterium]
MASEEPWLFKQGDLILGPVPPKQIVDKIYAGELDGRSEIQQVGSDGFRPLAMVETFKVHLAKADAKRRVDRHAEASERDRLKRRTVAIIITAVVLVLIAGAVVFGGSYLAVHTPGRSAEDLYAELISVDPPVIGKARQRSGDEELIDYPGLPGGKKPATGGQRPSNPGNPGVPRSPGAGSKTTDPGDDPDGMQTAKIDQDAINAVVKANQRSLFPCLAAIGKPASPQKIPIEFSIGGNGRVSKVWVDHPEYKNGPLPECLLGQLQKWPFKPHEGENVNVSLAFTVGNK